MLILSWFRLIVMLFFVLLMLSDMLCMWWSDFVLLVCISVMVLLRVMMCLLVMVGCSECGCVVGSGLCCGY